jgi:hypothetical protein
MVKTNIQTFTGEVEVLEEFYVGSNLVANDVATHVLTVNNTANDAKIKSDFFVGDGGLLSNIATTLQSIADQGNAASNVILFNSNTDVAGYKNVGFVTTSNVGIQNTAPTHTMSIGDKIIIDNNTDESQGESVMLVHGRISADRFQGDGGLLSNIATTLESIADQGNASSNVLIFNSNTDISGYRGVGFVTTSNVGIQNTNPGFNTLSVGSNLFVNIYGSNVLTVHGNAAVSNLLVSDFSVSPAHGLQHVTQEGRATNQTVQLTNTTTGLEVSSNINVAGEVILTNATKGLDVTSNIEIGGRLKFDTNVFVDTLRVADVAANIVTYDRTTGELLDSSGTFMNKFAVVSEQPPSDLFANATTVTNHGGYTLTTSNLATNSNTYNAFDGTANAWVSGDLAGGYIGGANVFLETNLTQLSNLHPTQFGDWLAIEFPYKTTLRHMKLTPLTAAQFPASANIYATNNDLTWTEVNYWSGRNPVTASNVQTITVNATEQFKKYALVATKAAGNSSNVAIQDWQLFTESFSIDGGKVAMAQQAATGGETVMDQHGPHGRGGAKLKKYPEIAFEEEKFDKYEGDTSSNTYIQAGYIARASSHVPTSDGEFDQRQVWRLFDGLRANSTDHEGWMAKAGSYATDGLPTAASPTRFTGDQGQWAEIGLPHKIKLQRFSLAPGNNGNSLGNGQARFPKVIAIHGYDGSSWTRLQEFTTTQVQSLNETQTFEITTPTGYHEKFVLVVKQTWTGDVSSNSSLTNFDEWKLYGYEELATQGDTSIDTTFTSIMNTPQTTGAQVYVDGSLGGNANTNRVVGPAAANTAATYDTTGKYWELNGTLTSNISVEANTFLEGDAPHSVSVWFNSSNLEANVSNTCVFSISDQEKLDSQNLDLQSNTWHNLTYAYQGEGGSRVTYLDGRKVAEDQAEDTFGDYPPFEIGTYSLGGYTVDASYWNTGGAAPYYRLAYNMFNGSASGRVTGFHNDNGNYVLNPADANYDATLMTLTDTSGTAHLGHWVSLELPYKLSPSYCEFEHYGSSYRLKDFVILGSNDDPRIVKTGFTLLFSGQAHVDNNGLDKTIHTFTGSGKFKYLILLTKTLNTATSTWIINRLQYYGHRENDLVRLPDPTNVLKYPHIDFPIGSNSNGPTGIRGYVASASSSSNNGIGRRPWSAFNDLGEGKANLGGLWQNDESSTKYTAQTTGLATTNAALFEGVRGEWIKLELPHKLKVSQVYILTSGSHEGVEKAILYGSNDDTNWDVIKDSGTAGVGFTFTLTTNGGLKEATESVTTSNYYKYLLLQVTEVVVGSGSGEGRSLQMYKLQYYGTEEATPVPIQIGGGNIDKVANFRVYDKFVGEDQALEIWDAQKDTFRGVKNSVTLHKGRLGIGTTEPEGRLAVLDEPHNLEEFPPRAMTGYKTYFEGHGDFCASASSEQNTTTTLGWHVFAKTRDDINKRWRSDSNLYDNTVNPATTTTANAIFDGIGVRGEWILLEMPYNICLKKYEFIGFTSQTPHTGQIWGSDDSGTTWHHVDTFQNAVGSPPDTYPTPTNTFHVLGNTRYYSKYVFIVEKVASADDAVSMSALKYFGTREQGQSVLHDGQLTLTKSLTVPRIGPALDADDTPRRDRLVVEYNTSTNPTFEGAVRDTSGRGNDGVFYGGASYDATEKAFEFDGTTSDQYVHTFKNGTSESGNLNYTVSLWFNPTTVNISRWRAIFVIGTLDRTQPTDNNGDEISMYVKSGGNVLHLQNGGSSFETTDTLTPGRWVHIVLTYDGTNRKIYLDGSLSVSHGYNALNLPKEMLIRLAQSTPNGNVEQDEYMDCKISNFKTWFGAALTASEAKTLYDMGRNGSVANPQPLHIAAPLYAPGTICQVGIVPFPRENKTISNGTVETLTTFYFKPKFANSRLFFTLTIYCQTANNYWNIWVYRNDSDRITSHSTGVYGITGQNYSSVGGGHQVRVGQGYDDPNTTESQKYSVKFASGSGGNGVTLGVEGPHLLKIEEICQ